MWNAAGRRGDIDGSQPSHLRGLGRAVPWAAAAWLLLGALPRRPWANGAGVDASWYLALNYIHEQGVRFGREIAYTAGPLAYLFTPEPEFASGHAVLALRIAIWGLIVLAVLAAMQRFGPAPGAAVAFVLATQALLDRSPADVWQAAYMAALLSAAWAGGWAPVRLGIAGFAAGFSLLLKINEGWAATALFYVLCVSALRRHHPGRTQGIALLALPPAILFAWFALAERDLLAVFPYLWNSIETMRGYSQAMSLDGPLWQLGLTLLYGGLILSVPALSSESSWLRQPVLFCFLLSAFMGFKHAMVRQDGHADLALQKLALAGLFLLPVCAGPCLQRALLLVLSFGSAFTWFYVAQEQPWLVRFAFSRLSASGIAAAAGNLVNWEREYQQLEQLSRGARAHLRLPEEFHQRIGRETVDGFPHCVDVIRANGWKYRPRPTIESSGAYTQALDQMNAAHFLSGRAPGFTLIVWETIDGRHPYLSGCGHFAGPPRPLPPCAAQQPGSAAGAPRQASSARVDARWRNGRPLGPAVVIARIRSRRADLFRRRNPALPVRLAPFVPSPVSPRPCPRLEAFRQRKLVPNRARPARHSGPNPPAAGRHRLARDDVARSIPR